MTVLVLERSLLSPRPFSLHSSGLCCVTDIRALLVKQMLSCLPHTLPPLINRCACILPKITQHKRHPGILLVIYVAVVTKRNRNEDAFIVNTLLVSRNTTVNEGLPFLTSSYIYSDTSLRIKSTVFPLLCLFYCCNFFPS